jgi:hypothetical protein
MRAIVLVALAMMCGGCVGPLVPVTKVDEEAASQLAATIRVFEPAETPKKATVLGPLTATSCKNKIWDKDATKEDAVAQLRHRARERGGNAVGNLACEGIEGTSLAKNCWASITCTGTALKLASSR